MGSVQLHNPVGFSQMTQALANYLGINSLQLNESLQTLTNMFSLEDPNPRNAERNMVEAQQTVEESNIIESAEELVTEYLPKFELSEFQIRTAIQLFMFIAQSDQDTELVIAIIVRFTCDGAINTQALAASTAEDLGKVVEKLNDFYRTLQYLKQEESELSTYITVRIRGKYLNAVENKVAAATTLLATQVCELSPSISIGSMRESELPATGFTTRVLLRPVQLIEKPSAYDYLARVFIIGDTRSGKSTIGNALVRQNRFTAVEGMTGTLDVERGERIDISGRGTRNEELILTEYFDTPGMNDANGLDSLYQASIEDRIRVLKQCSAFIMTVAVDGGITGSMTTSTEGYRSIFGENLGSMLVIVLTLNTAASKMKLKTVRARNLDKLNRLDKRIESKQVFCISLADLRSGSTNTYSHEELENIAKYVRVKKMVMIEKIEDEGKKVLEYIETGSDEVQTALRRIINDGWMSFDTLSDEYKVCGYTKFLDRQSGVWYNGFAMKKTGVAAKTAAVFSLGLINPVRKVAIHVYAMDNAALHSWMEFDNTYRGRKNDPSLMHIFGSFMLERNLAVFVSHEKEVFVGTLRTSKYILKIFRPPKTNAEVSKVLTRLLSDKNLGIVSQ